MSETHVVEHEISEEMLEPGIDALVASEGMDRPLPSIRDFVIPCLVAVALASVLILFGVREALPWPYFLVVGLPIAASILLFGGYLTHFLIRLLCRRIGRYIVRKGMWRSGDPRVRWSFNQDGLSLQEGAEFREIGWGDVKDLFIAPKVWVLKVRADRPIWLLWSAALPGEVDQFIRTQVRQFRVPIRTAGDEAEERGRDDGQGHFRGPEWIGPRY